MKTAAATHLTCNIGMNKCQNLDHRLKRQGLNQTQVDYFLTNEGLQKTHTSQFKTYLIIV